MVFKLVNITLALEIEYDSIVRLIGNIWYILLLRNTDKYLISWITEDYNLGKE